MAISLAVVAMKIEIATSACSLLAMTHQDSPAVQAPTHKYQQPSFRTTHRGDPESSCPDRWIPAFARMTEEPIRMLFGL